MFDENSKQLVIYTIIQKSYEIILQNFCFWGYTVNKDFKKETIEGNVIINYSKKYKIARVGACL